ncbi:glycosyltransferase [Microbacterium resistens]
MVNSGGSSVRLRWHTNDYLVGLHNGDEQTFTPWSLPAWDGGSESSSVTGAAFGVPTLALIAGDRPRHERLSVLRASSWEDRTLQVFGARTRSRWALDALAGRATQFGEDWASLQAATKAGEPGSAAFGSPLDDASLSGLLAIADVLLATDVDADAAEVILSAVARRFTAGETLEATDQCVLLELLVRHGLGDHAAAALRVAEKGTWAAHATAVQLAHPRLGGTTETLLARMNEPYRRLGVESIELTAAGAPSFAGLHAGPQTKTGGPLVSIAMVVGEADDAFTTSIRSIVAQTYQDWELLLVGGVPSPELDQAVASDPRIRLIRDGGTTEDDRTLLNAALQASQGEFFTVHSASSWAHPHRIEVQVHDLLSNPGRLSNTVRAQIVSPELDVITRCGAAFDASDATLLFRRDVAIAAIGYFDSAAPYIGTDYRLRLEATTRTTAAELAPGAPLVLELETAAPAHSAGRWGPATKPPLLAASRRRAKRISEGKGDPHVGVADAGLASSVLQDASAAASAFDIVVVLDARELSSRRSFLRTVVTELRAVLDAGLRVAVMQVCSLQGPRAQASFPSDLQDLLDQGRIALVPEGVPISADTAVVRHAGAAQGHPAVRKPVTASRVVVVEDARAGDDRGRTVASADVIDTVTGWFGVEPEWTVALPEIPAHTVSAVSVRPKEVRLMISGGAPEYIRWIRLHQGEATIDLTPTVVAAELVSATKPTGELAPGEWRVTVGIETGEGRLVEQACPVSPDVVVWNGPDRVGMRTADGALRLLPDAATESAPSSSDFSREFLTASVTGASVDQGHVTLTIAAESAAPIVGVYALREVDGGVVRRRDFTPTTDSHGRKAWRRTLSKFAGSRWRIFGSFQTSLGRVEFPLALDATASTDGTRDWQPQVLSGGRLYVAPPVPGRIASAGQRVSRAAQGALIDPARKALRTISSRGDGKSRIIFGPQHAAPRTPGRPTVSVVMPVYNVEPYLDAAISSVLDQDFSDLELILIDDASTDNGRSVIEKYWKKDRRVRAFGLDHNTLGGAGIPSNVGIRAARGTYVAFADSDDHVSPDGLAALVASAESASADLAIGDFRTFTGQDATGTESYDRAVWADLPVGQVLSAATHPDLFRLSPVPWRKLYRRAFLQEHGILYPEGDYFYEDNPLHWFVLSRAERVVLNDTVVSFHRMEREGQTMSAQAYKMGAFVSHMNTTMRFLTQSDSAHRSTLVEAFIGFLDRTHWTATRQTQPVASALIKRGFGDVYAKAVQAAPGVALSARTRTKMAEDQAAYPDVDLTIVIPVYNNADLVSGTIDSVLSLRGISFNVLLVDDGSTDDSLAVMRGYESRHPNVHVFAQGNRGAGRARNSVIPLCTGRYTYFLDADDHVDSRSLAASVRHADATSADLVFVKYRIDFADEGRSKGMFDADRDLWKQAAVASSATEKENLAARLINYPWNRIIRTSLLHDANIFFGATVVHNDVLFHWHSIVSAEAIEFFDAEVCVHRKFAVRQQVTNVNDARRMAVLEALRDTHSRISQLGNYDNVRDEWRRFADHLLSWAQERIPADLQEEYARRRALLLESFDRG